MNCKIRAQLGFLPTEIHADLQKVNGNSATVCMWVRHFNDGWESIEYDPRVGRLVFVLMEKNIGTVKTLIEEEACYTVQEIEELSGIHSSSVLQILLERLGLQSVHAGCPICSLTSKNKVGLDLHRKL